MNKKVIALMIALCMIITAVPMLCFVSSPNDSATAAEDVGDYLNFTFPDDGGTICLENRGENNPDCSYSFDLISWKKLSTNPITVDGEKTIYVKGKNESGFSIDILSYTSFKFTVNNESADGVVAHGNVMSLLFENDFKDKKEIPEEDFCFFSLFSNCDKLVTAPALPATTLAENCYESMFFGCTSLTAAPALPAATLAESCYGSMFSGCQSLTVAPALPATTLTDHCYEMMFYGCSSLTEAPILPATTLAENCYESMFFGCQSLTVAPALPATTLAIECYQYMFRGCSSLTAAPALPAATTLAENCYASMFSGCLALNTIMCSEVIDKSYTTDWLCTVSHNGVFYTRNEEGWGERGDSRIPENWRVVENYSAVIFDSMGGTIYKDDIPYQNFMIANDYGKLTELPTANRDGWGFVDWFSSDGERIDLDREYEENTDTIVYAHWGRNTLVFDSNGGTGGPFFISGYKSIIIPQDVPSRDGYTFTGWMEDGSETTYKPGDEYVFIHSKGVILHAVWEKIPPEYHDVIYDTAGGTDEPLTETVEKGGTFTVAKYSGHKDGYTFKSWLCSNGTQYLGGETITMGDEDLVFTAQWEKNPDSNIPLIIVIVIAIIEAIIIAGTAIYFWKFRK